MAVWRRVAQKARKKEERRRREKQRRKRRRRRRENGGWGCEAAVKRGRVRVGPSQLAGRVDADRESKGCGLDGRGWRGQGKGQKGDGGEVSGERVTGGRRWRIGENRARLGFAMTNGRRGHSARRSYRSKGDCYVGLSVECLSCPGHLIRPQRGGSFVFLVFQTPAAAPYFPFVRAIYRPASPPPHPSVFSLSFLCTSNTILIRLSFLCA